MNIDIPGVYLPGVCALLGGVLAWWGVLYIAQGVVNRFDERFEWDRPSWRPWQWRAFRRWYAPGQVVETEDYETARVLDVDFGPDGHPLDTWVRVQPYRAEADLADPPCWLPLADLLPAAEDRFDEPDEHTADELALSA